MLEQEWLVSDSPSEMMKWIGQIGLIDFMDYNSARLLVENWYRHKCRPSATTFDATFLYEEKDWRFYIEKKVAANIIRDVFGNPWRPVLTYEQCNKCTCGLVCFDGVYGVEPYRCDNCYPVENWLTSDVQALVAGMMTPKVCWNCNGAGRYTTFEGGPFDRRYFKEDCPYCNGTGKTCDFSDMPILGDALEDAGCENEEVLNHCRGLERCGNCLGSPGWDMTAHSIPMRCLPCNDGWRPMQGQHTPGCWVLRLLWPHIDEAGRKSPPGVIRLPKDAFADFDPPVVVETEND